MATTTAKSVKKSTVLTELESEVSGDLGIKECKYFGWGLKMR